VKELRGKRKGGKGGKKGGECLATAYGINRALTISLYGWGTDQKRGRRGGKKQTRGKDSLGPDGVLPFPFDPTASYCPRRHGPLKFLQQKKERGGGKKRKNIPPRGPQFLSSRSQEPRPKKRRKKEKKRGL